MRFLVDADLPRSVAGAIRECGHEAVDVRDVGLRSAKDPEIAAYALREGLCLITRDAGFGDLRNYPPESYHGIVVLHAPHGTASQVVDIVKRFLSQHELLAQLPGRLALVEAERVRLRGNLLPPSP